MNDVDIICNFRTQVDPVVLFDAVVQKKVTDRAADIEVRSGRGASR